MKTRILRSEIESFKIQAAFIKKAESIRPILNYLRIDISGDWCAMMKSNDKSFLVKQTPNDSDDCSFLVDEKILYNFIDFSSEEYIHFEDEGNRIRISDGRGNISSPTEKPSGFPSIETSDNEFIEIPKLALVTAGICSEVIFDGEIFNAKSFVFLGRGFISASDANIGYMQAIPGFEKEIILRKEVAVCISKMNTCKYSGNENYDFFLEDTALFGFSKSEIAFFDITAAIGPIKENIDFSINKQPFIKWNTLCTSSSTNKGGAATFKVSEGVMSLEMVDTKAEITAKSRLFVTGSKGEFKFDPVMMSNLLKVVPCEDVFFYPGNNRYYITDINRSFTAAIMLIL